MTRSDRLFLYVLFITLLFPLSSLADSFSLSDAQLFVTTTGSPNDPLYTGDPGGFYDGVAKIQIFSNEGWDGCSGALIDPIHVLTAAHCVDPAEVGTINEIDVDFLGGQSYVASSWVFDPLFNLKNIDAGNDLGIITLSSVAAGLTPYSLYGGLGFGSTVDIAGYGIGGTGTTGIDETNYDFGTFRHGQNEFDATTIDSHGNVLTGSSSSNLYLYEFAHPTSCSAPPADVTANEVMTAPGDSGGPSFINGQLAGVHSWGTTGCHGFSSYGSEGADIRVDQADNLAFIEGHSSASIAPVPEPSSLLLLGSALAAAAPLCRRRRDTLSGKSCAIQ